MINKIFNKNNLVKLIIISFFFSLFLEIIVFNFKVLRYNNKYKAEIVSTDGFIKKDGYFVSDKKSSSITVKLKDNYVSKIEFIYKYRHDFNWNSNDISSTSSVLINKATKKINIKDSKLKLSFNNKGIKIKDITVNNKIYFDITRFLVMFLTMVVTIILLVYKDYFAKYKEKAFLIISLTSGILMINSLPNCLYLSWDDSTHFMNANKFISSDSMEYSKTFDILKKQDYINYQTFSTKEERTRLYKSLDNLHKETKYKRLIGEYSNKYNKLVYFPFYLAFKIGSIFNISFIFSFIMAKVFNLLAYIVIFYFAIKISRRYKNYLFLIGLSLSTIFLATEFSYDPTITASIILAFSLYSNMLEDKKINNKYLLLFVLAVIWASLPKAIYAPLLLLILFLPNNKFKDKKTAITIKSLIVIITLLLMSTFVLPMLIGGVAGDARGGNTNASEQFRLIITNPFRYSKVLLRFLVVDGPKLFISVSALSNISYVSYLIGNKILDFTSLIFYLLLMYVLFSNRVEEKYLNNKTKILYGVMYLLIFALISTALYLSFTEVGSSNIAGVQSRYFLPLLPFLLVILTPTIKKVKKDNYELKEGLLLVTPFILLMMVIFVLVLK